MMQKLADNFEKCYWMKNDLTQLSRTINISSKGSKQQLTNRIIAYILHKNYKEKPTLVPNKRPDNITPKTKLKEGFKCDLITRNFFIKHIGSQFHYTYFLNEYARNNPNKTYQDAINFWIYQQNNKDEFKELYAKTNKFEYNNFIKDFYLKYPDATLDEIIDEWNKYKKERNKNCNKIKQQIIDLSLENN